MNIFQTLFFFLLIGSGLFAHAEEMRRASIDGETQLESGSGNTRVIVVISSKIMDGATVLGDRFEEAQFPNKLRVITELKISVGARMIFVPRSSFVDLVDVRIVELRSHGSERSLIIRGGDASEAYELAIYFDRTRITRRALFNESVSTKPLEETTYSRRVLEDK